MTTAMLYAFMVPGTDEYTDWLYYGRVNNPAFAEEKLKAEYKVPMKFVYVELPGTN